MPSFTYLTLSYSIKYSIIKNAINFNNSVNLENHFIHVNHTQTDVFKPSILLLIHILCFPRMETLHYFLKIKNLH